LFRAILFETTPHGSVIAGSETIWNFFGLDMSNGVSRAAMANYTVFIIPTVRTAAYSV
jgi:hypothetical protein